MGLISRVSSRTYRIPQRLKSFKTIKTPISTIEPVSRVEKLYEGLLSDDKVTKRVALSKAITLIETTHPIKRKQAEHLLSKLLKNDLKKTNSKSAFRIGLTGPPGAGKSTF